MLRQKRKSRVGRREARAQMQFMECAQSSTATAQTRRVFQRDWWKNPFKPLFLSGFVMRFTMTVIKNYPCLVGIRLKDSLREIASFWRHKNNRLLPRYDNFWSCHQLPSASERKKDIKLGSLFFFSNIYIFFYCDNCLLSPRSFYLYWRRQWGQGFYGNFFI